MGSFIEVTGSGAALQAPDRIDLHVSVTVVRSGVAEALAATGSGVRALGIAVRDAGLTDADIRSTSSNVSDEYAGPDGTRTGYRASQDLTLRVTDLDDLDTVMSAALTAVGDDFRLNHLAWAIADQGGLLERARAAAFADAEEKAGQLAAIAGARLGAVLRIVESEGFGDPVGRLALAKSDGAGFAPEQGVSQVGTSLTVRWAIG